MRTLKFYLVATLFIMIASCEPELNQPFETYLIKEGNHGTTPSVQFLQSTKLEFSAIFDESAMYISQDPINQHDVNKLLGFADCNVHHHTNSARFGWRWLENKLEILAYCYKNKERIVESIGHVDLNEPYDYSITLLPNQYLFHLEGFPEVTIPRETKCDIGAYYMLFPYFGGDEVAPQDIQIKILTKY